MTSLGPRSGPPSCTGSDGEGRSESRVFVAEGQGDRYFEGESRFGVFDDVCSAPAAACLRPPCLSSWILAPCPPEFSVGELLNGAEIAAAQESWFCGDGSGLASWCGLEDWTGL